MWIRDSSSFPMAEEVIDCCEGYDMSLFKKQKQTEKSLDGLSRTCSHLIKREIKNGNAT